MKKDEHIYIKHISDSINKILEYTRGLSEQEFLSKTMVQDAVIRQFEIIGEATKQISLEFQSRYQKIPWKKMEGLRDKLIHDYVGVDLHAVWVTVERDIIELDIQIKLILKNY